jgi:glycosyltransferase involved in cell wall biosynthesis
MPAIVALIPAYNCADRIGRVVTGIRRHVADVVVVDDGSADSTAAEAREAGARVVVHAKNRGKGPAIRSGLAAVLGQPYSHVLMLDGDGQHDPEDAPGFLAASGEADFVLGNRLWNWAAIPPRRFWTNFIGTRALELMTGFPLEDSQCGYRLVSAAHLRRMGLVGKRYSIDTEILVRAGKLRARFAHVPVRVIYGDAVSHYRPVFDTVHIVLSAVRFKVDEGDLRRDPGPEAWRVLVSAPNVLDPARGGGTGPAVGCEAPSQG